MLIDILRRNREFKYLILILLYSLALACGGKKDKFESFEIDDSYIWFRNDIIKLRIDNKMLMKVYFKTEKMGHSLNMAEPEEFLLKPPHYVTVSGREVKNFNLISEKPQISYITNNFGSGKRLILRGITDESEKIKIEKRLIIELYEKFPDTAIMYAVYKNLEDYRTITIEKIYSNSFRLDASLVNKMDEPYDFWSFHGISEYTGDWVVKITENFSRTNYCGTKRIIGSNSAYTSGQGIPLVDLWTERMGMAVAMIESEPKIVSFPVNVEFDKTVRVSVLEEPKVKLKPGDSFQTFKYAVIVHKLDYFDTLKRLKELLTVQDYTVRNAPQIAYHPYWSTRGFGSNFMLNDIYNNFSQLKKLGIGWIVIDKGWYNRFGDWIPVRKIFPSGEESVKEIVYLIHKNGFKAMLWWVPFSVHIGSLVSKEHPEWFILNEKGEREESGWGSYYICPAHPGVKEYTVNLIRKFINDWGFDGFYLDGACLNSVPFCYAANHNHRSPMESLKSLSEFFKIIYETAIEIKPDFVIKVSSDGICPSVYNMFQYNMPVVGSPNTRFQLRSGIKALKALFEEKAPVDCNYYEEGTWDFASCVAPGGVIPVAFTTLNPDDTDILRRTEPNIPKPAKYTEMIYERWFTIYREKKLYNGEYLNLYDIGFDKPETHLIKKGEKFYYSFFSTFWDGKIELRGLEKKRYQVRDYIHNVDLGSVKGPEANIEIGFKEFLLLELTPR